VNIGSLLCQPGWDAGHPPLTDQEYMMANAMVSRIRDNPRYRELKAKRNQFGWTLAISMLVVYYGFISLIAFKKDFLAQRLGDGVMTIGVPLGFAVIVFTIVITGIYVRRANTEFDALTDEILKDSIK
jgi:uncharacterized membrane protein (DUF485 family)